MWNHLRSGIVGGIVAGAVILVGSAVAGSGVGSVFNLGQSNTVNAPSGLSGTTAGKQLIVANLGTASSSSAVFGFAKGASPAATFQNGGAGPAVSLLAGAGQPPFTTNSAYRVANLNADKLDGIDSRSFAQTYPGLPGNGAGTAKTLVGSNAVSVGSESGLLTVPGVAHVSASCSATQGYVKLTTDTSGDIFWETSDRGHGYYLTGSSITTYFGAGQTERYT
ncbi:MAG: hypothetical protein QOE36_21, partial [Gaiellaceae bacterium]|nr:hypothetical protein [Gaiellaceae bacterium]